MKRTPFLSRILSLLGTVVAVTLTPQEVAAGTMHSDVPMVTYMDFGQNMGRYAVGSNVNALLGHIRTHVDQGIVIHYTDGTPSYTISNSQGMIDYSAVHDGGYAAAMGPNMIATVAHNGEINGSFAERIVGSAHAINYSAVGVRYSHQAARDEVVFRLVPTFGNTIFDYCLQRQTKVFTDISWAPMSTVTDVASMRGEYQYHAGAGSMNMWSETDGKYHFNQGSLIGSIKTINITSDREHDCWIIISDPDYGNGVGASTANPLPIGTEGGDSGSPVFIYNSTTGQYEYFVAHEGGTGISSAQGWGNIKWSHEALQQFNVSPDMSSGEVHLHAITSAGEYYADKAGNSTTTYYGYATDAAGNILTQYTGVRSGLNTWADLSGIRNLQNWYAWDSDAYIRQSDVDLFFTENLVFTATQAESKIVLDATVDLGIGYAEFNAGETDKAVFTISSAEGEQNLFNHAGYVINEGAEVHLQLTNPADYMTEWRKTGAGDLYIDGTGNTNALLAVGGSGSTYLQQKDGWAAYNVIVGSGATVVISDISQIARDLTIGNDGGVLDMNGQSMDWYNTNPNVEAAGFSINALTEGAIITNSTGTTTLTYKESGNRTWLGSFADTAGGILKIVYDGGGTWTMHSIHTDMSHHAESGLSVASGKVVFSGTHTVHGKGSETGHTSNRLLLENDWHYADAKMNVAVADGATFELGSHARLTGNVTVAEGGTFIMREGVHDRYEHVEGGVYLEDTYQYADFYGLKGDIALGGEMQVEYSAGTTANTTLSGSLSGAGKLTVAAGTTGGTLTLAGDNSQFTGQKSITSGGVIATSNAALGSADKQWLIGKQGWLASHGFTEGTDILSYIDTASAGTLALSHDLTGQLDFSEHTGLFLGAEVGKTVQYGAEGTTDVWTAVGENYLLGGGGGTLVVNYKLTGETTGLVLGADASSTGKVVLANSGNDFGGSITFAGTGITLEAVAGAMSGASLSLSYGNALLSAAPQEDISRLATDSDGILLVDKIADSDISLLLPGIYAARGITAHAGLSVGASVDTVYTGNLTLAEGESYIFSTVNGATLTLATQLSDAHDMIADAQGMSGGTVVLAGNESYAGNITVQGHRDGVSAGDITLAFGRDTLLSGDITLAQGGTLDVVSHQLTLAGNVIGAGGSIVNSSWAGPLDAEWSGTLTLHAEAGESHSISAAVSTPVIYKTGAGNVTLSAANTYTDMYLQEGTLTMGQADALSIYGTVHMSGGATLDLATYQLSKNTYMNAESIIVESGSATVQQSGATADHVSLIQGNVLLREGTELHLKGAGIYELSGTSFGGENAVLHVDAPRLRLQSGSTVNIDGTLSYSADGSLHSQATNNGMVRNINALQMLNGATLTLSEQGGTNYWQLNSLSGEGTLQWNSTTNHVNGANSTASRLVISGASDFEGSIRLNRSNGNQSHTHGAYLELAHDQAAQFADISLSGANANSWASLAVNTDQAVIKGLSGNEFSYVFAGAAASPLLTANAHPASTRASALNIHVDADKTYTFAGVVGHSADTAATGLSLIKSGAGTQAFTGTAYLGHVSVLGGTLSFDGSTSITGNVDLTYGANLSGVDYTLGSGQIFRVQGTSPATADFGGTLTLAGGELIFEGTGLQSGLAALSLGSVVQLEGNAHVISLTNTGGLSAGTTYTLATGDWTSLLGSLSVSSSMAWDAALSTNDSGHLLLTLNNKSGSQVWDGNASAHIWSSTQFGSTACALGQEAIAVFDDTASHATVQVTENVSVAEAHFRSAKHAYTVSAQGGVATVGSMTVNGNVTLQSGMLVTGQTTIDSGELILQSTGMLQGSITGSGTLSIDWGDVVTESLNFNQLHTLRIMSGSYGAKEHSALDVGQIVVESGARYIQGDNVTQGADIVSRGGVVELAGGGLTGCFTLEADTELAIRSGDVAFNTIFADQGHTLTQTGNGIVHLGAAFSGSLSHYIVQGGTLKFDAPLAAGVANLITVGANAKLVLGGKDGDYYNHYAHYLKSVVVESGGTLQLNQYAAANIDSVVLRGGNYLLSNGGWWNYSTSNVNLLVDESGTIKVQNGGDSSVVRGTISGSGSLTFSGAGSARYALESIISDGEAPLALIFADTGVIVKGTNTYSGGTTINGGFVQVNNVQALGLGTLTMNGGELYLANDLYINGLGGSGGVVSLNGKSIVLDNENSAHYAGTVQGAGAIYHIGTGSSTMGGTVDVDEVVAAAGSLSLTGDTTIRSGGVVAEGASLTLDGSIALGNAIENAGVVSIGASATFALSADDFIDGVITLVQGTGTIQYADTLTQADLIFSGYDLSDLQNNGVQLTIVNTADTLAIQANAFRDLVWTGSKSGDAWNTTDAHWVGSVTGQNAVAGKYDNVVFDATAQWKDVQVASGASVMNMTVRDAAYSFYGAGLNVTGNFLVESGASVTLEATPNQLGNAVVEGTLILEGSATLGSLYVDASEGTIIKNTTSTLTWNVADGKSIDVGTFINTVSNFTTSSALNIGTFELQKGAFYLQNKQSADAETKKIGCLVLGNGSSVVIQNESAPSHFTTLGEVRLAGATATIRDNYGYGTTFYEAYVRINQLSLAEGVESGTLNLQMYADRGVAVYDIGSADSGSNNFAGTILLDTDYSAEGGHAAVILSGENVAKGAGISLVDNAGNGVTVLGLGVHAERTHIAGLESDRSMGNRAKVFSGTIGCGQSSITDASITDVAERTLVISTAADSTHTFYGEVLSTVNIEKQGSGTQVLAGTIGSSKLSVLGGTLSLAGATIGSGALAQVELGRGATLQHSLTVDGAHALHLTGTSGATGTATLEGQLILGGGMLSFDTAWLSETEASLTVTGGISLAGGMSTQTITLTSDTGLMQGSSYLLLAGDFAAGLTTENFTLAGLSGAVAGSLSLADGGLWLQMGVSDTAHVWAGTDDAHVWSATLYGTAVSGVLAGGAAATFDDSAANRNVLIEGSVSAPAGMVFDNKEDYNISSGTLNSSISTSSFALTNTGSVTLGVALEAESISLAQGTLVLRDGAKLNNDVQVSLSDGATLDITSTTQSFTGLSMEEGTTIADFYGSGMLTIKDPAKLEGTVNVGTINTQGEVSLAVGSNTHTLHVQSGSASLRGEYTPANVLLDANTTLAAERVVTLGSESAIRVMGSGVTVAADITFGADSTLAFDNATLSETTAALAFSGTLSLAENAKVNVALGDVGALRDGGTWVLATGDWSAFSDSSFVFDYKTPEMATFSISGNTLSMTLAAHRIWAGTPADYQWNSTTFGPDAACPEAAIALFDDTAENTHIRLTESVSVGGMRFGNDNAYSINAEDGAAIANAGNLYKTGKGELVVNADLSVAGDVSLAGGNVTFAGMTNVTGNVTQTAGIVTLSHDGSALGDYTIRNASTLNIEGAGISMGKLYALRLDGAMTTINVTGGSASFSDIDLENYTTLNFRKPQGAESAEYVVSGRLGFTSAWASDGTRVLVEEGVKLKLGSIHNPWGWGSFEINGDVEVAGAISLSSGSVDPITGTGSLTAGSLFAGNTGTYIFDVAQTTISGEVSIAGGSATILRSGTFTSESKFAQTGSKLTLEGGTLNLNGTSTFSGGTLNLISGKMDVQSGITTISNTVNATGGEVVVSGGTLKLATKEAATQLMGCSDSFTLSNGGILDLSAISFGTSGDAAIVLSATSSVSLSGGVVELANLASGTTYQIFNLGADATLDGWTALTTSNFILNGMNMSKLGRLVLNLGSTGTFSYTQDVRDLTWSGAAGTHAWNATDINWTYGDAGTASEFANGDSVTFASDASVSVQGEVITPTLTVKEGVRVTLSGESVAATTLVMNEGAALLGSVHIGSGTGLTIHGSAELGDLYLAKSGDMTLSPAEGKTYTIGSLHNVATLSMQGKGTLNLGDATLTNLVFATRTTWASRIGELAILGTVEVSDLLSVGWGTLNLTSADARVTTKRFRASTYGREATSVVNIDGGTLTITGEHDGTSETEADIAFLLAHWNDASTTINLNAGSIVSEKAVMYMGWDSCGNFNALGGMATLKGIQFSTARTDDVDTFALGDATSGSAVVNIGSFGIKGMAANDVVKLGHGTLKATDDFSITGNSAITMVATSSETLPGTIFDTNGHNITVETAVSGSGAMVKRGEGTLAFTAASGAFTGTVAVEAGTLQVDATSASLLGGASGLSLVGGVLDLSALNFTTEASGAMALSESIQFNIDTNGVLDLGALEEGSTYYIFSGGAPADWALLTSANFALDGTSLADMGNVHLSLRSVEGGYSTFCYNIASVLHWVGTSSGAVWDTSSTNWDTAADADASNNVAFIEGDDVIFGVDAANKAVTLKGDVTVGKMTVNADDYSFAPVDSSSSASITMDEWDVSVTDADNKLKLGTGTGTLNVTVNESSSVTGAVDLYWGTTLNLKGLNHEIDKIIMRGSSTEGSTLNISSAKADITTIEMRNTSTLTFGVQDGSVAGEYKVTNLTIGNNGNTRTIVVNEEADVSVGTMSLNTSSWGGAHTTTLSGGGLLEIGTLSVTEGELNITNSQTTITTANLTGGTVNVGSGATTMTTVNVNSGSVDMGIATGATVGNLTISGGLNLMSNAELSTAVSLVLSGALSIEQGGKWTLNGATQSLTETQLSGIQGTLEVGSAATLKMTNKTTAKNNVSTALDHVVGAGTVVLDYAIEQSDNGIGFNFSGLTGTVQVDSGRVLISSSTFNTEEGAAQPTFKLTSANSQLVFNGEGTVLKSDVELAANTTFHVNSGKSATISGEMSGSGGFSKAGAGTLTLSGANTYTGATTVSGGTLELAGAVSMAAQGNIALASGTSLLLNATNEDAAMSLGNAITGTGTIHKKGSYETVLSGNVAATTINVKDGTNQATNAGTLTLTGATVTVDTLYAAYGQVNIGAAENGNTFMTVSKVELGDSSTTNSTIGLAVRNGSTLSITGNNNGTGSGWYPYKNASLLVSEWEADGTLDVQGKLLVQHANVSLGDKKSYININGGTLAALGITQVRDNTGGALELNLSNDGKLIVGANGVSTDFTDVKLNLGAGTVGMSAATTTIAEDVTLNSAEGTTFDTTQYAFETTENVATDIVRGTEAGEMTLSANISSAEGVAAKMKVAGSGSLNMNGAQNTLSGGLEVEKGATVNVSTLASISAGEAAAPATMEGAVSISHADDAATIAGTDADAAATVNNSLITIAQGASLRVENIVISETSRIQGATTFAARVAGATGLTAVDTTIQLGSGNADVAGAPATLAQGTLVSLDGTATKVQMASNFTTLAVTSNALSSLTLNAGSSLTIDFSSLLTDVQIANIDLIELSFADVNVDWTADNITITGTWQNNRMTAYYLAPTETAVANVGSIYFATDSIPEPTSTTLSLLALAALAARRRRK